jgi:hypothetical protein
MATDNQIQQSIRDTQEHIRVVKKIVRYVEKALSERADAHDNSKLEEPELSAFAKYGPQLSTVEYGSPEYKAALVEMQPAVQHHYRSSRHHPEHFEGGINDMNIIDLIEMVCDWKAASMRMKDGGNFKDSIAFNRKRFGLSAQLVRIFANSNELLEEATK